MEAETINAGTEFIRDTAQQVGEHTEKQIVKTEVRQIQKERVWVSLLGGA